MEVAFFTWEHHGRRQVGWEAVRGKRTRIPGTVMAAQKGLPHDLLQYVVEAACGFQDGFWGLVARGATFRSTDRRATRPGRALIAAHRADLARAEALAGLHQRAWAVGQRSAVTEALDRARASWEELRPGEHLVFTWPSASGSPRSGLLAGRR